MLFLGRNLIFYDKNHASQLYVTSLLNTFIQLFVGKKFKNWHLALKQVTAIFKQGKIETSNSIAKLNQEWTKFIEV